MEGFDFDASTGCLRVNGEFTVYQAAAAHQVLLDFCGSGELQTLDLSEVSEFDCAALQLLLSLQKTPGAEHVRIVQASEPVRAAVELLQLHTLLNDSEATE